MEVHVEMSSTVILCGLIWWQFYLGDRWLILWCKTRAVDLWESSVWDPLLEWSPRCVEFLIDSLIVICEPKDWLLGISMLYCTEWLRVTGWASVPTPPPPPGSPIRATIWRSQRCSEHRRKDKSRLVRGMKPGDRAGFERWQNPKGRGYTRWGAKQKKYSN